MKILCDENLPHDLRACLAHHDVFTVSFLGWGGIKNGKLLEAAEANGFDLLLTGDKTIEYEQNLRGRRIAIVALSAVNWPVIEPNLPAIILAVDRAQPGTFARVECGTFSRRRPGLSGPSPG